MRTIRWLAAASLIVVSSLGPLAGPVVADEQGRSPIVRFTGVVEQLPQNEGNPWLIGGREVQVGERTRIIEVTGPLEVGSEVYVVARQAGDESLEAILIRPQPPAQVMLRFRWVEAALQRAYGLLSRFTVRWRNEVQTRSRALTQTQAQERIRTPEQKQAQDAARTQEQLRLRDQSCTQEQTQQRLQDQSCTPEQSDTRTQVRTRAQAGGR